MKIPTPNESWFWCFGSFKQQNLNWNCRSMFLFFRQGKPMEVLNPSHVCVAGTVGCHPRVGSACLCMWIGCQRGSLCRDIHWSATALRSRVNVDDRQRGRLRAWGTRRCLEMAIRKFTLMQRTRFRFQESKLHACMFSIELMWWKKLTFVLAVNTLTIKKLHWN